MHTEGYVVAANVSRACLQAGVSRSRCINAVCAARLESHGDSAGAPAAHWAPDSAGQCTPTMHAEASLC